MANESLDRLIFLTTHGMCSTLKSNAILLIPGTCLSFRCVNQRRIVVPVECRSVAVRFVPHPNRLHCIHLRWTALRRLFAALDCWSHGNRYDPNRLRWRCPCRCHSRAAGRPVAGTAWMLLATPFSPRQCRSTWPYAWTEDAEIFPQFPPAAADRFCRCSNHARPTAHTWRVPCKNNVNQLHGFLKITCIMWFCYFLL